MTESGFASAADVDTGMELGCAHPMGPLKPADLIGLDTVASIAESLYDEFKEPLYAPPPPGIPHVRPGLSRLCAPGTPAAWPTSPSECRTRSTAP
jgi:3-hydroxybutyryl-CoA dehydrogenase